jgi:hypothetical protein
MKIRIGESQVVTVDPAAPDAAMPVTLTTLPLPPEARADAVRFAGYMAPSPTANPASGLPPPAIPSIAQADAGARVSPGWVHSAAPQPSGARGGEVAPDTAQGEAAASTPRDIPAQAPAPGGEAPDASASRPVVVGHRSAAPQEAAAPIHETQLQSGVGTRPDSQAIAPPASRRESVPDQPHAVPASAPSAASGTQAQPRTAVQQAALPQPSQNSQHPHSELRPAAAAAQAPSGSGSGTGVVLSPAQLRAHVLKRKALGLEVASGTQANANAAAHEAGRASSVRAKDRTDDPSTDPTEGAAAAMAAAAQVQPQPFHPDQPTARARSSSTSNASSFARASAAHEPSIGVSATMVAAAQPPAAGSAAFEAAPVDATASAFAPPDAQDPDAIAAEAATSDYQAPSDAPSAGAQAIPGAAPGMAPTIAQVQRQQQVVQEIAGQIQAQELHLQQVNTAETMPQRLLESL